VALNHNPRGRRSTPPEPHPIDALARTFRESDTPRQDFANEVDDLIVAWAARGYVEQTVTVFDWIRTLAYAADAREADLGMKVRRDPAAAPWEGFA
jgi:hypothetical protein